MLPKDKQKIIDLCYAAQKATAVHQKNSTLLADIAKNGDENEFFEIFTKHILNKILAIDKKTHYVDKMMEFVATFCSSLGTKKVYVNTESEDETDVYEEVEIEHPLVKRFLIHLLKLSNVNKDEMRLRVCQIINKILNKLVGIDISEDLCESLEKSLIQKVQDTKSSIREQAVIGLYRLQDPTNPEDSIIEALMHLMNSDICPKVRQLCVEKVAVRKDVLGHMMNRIRDISDSVRLAALKRLSNLAKFLKIGERRQILEWLFVDQSEKVKQQTTTLIKTFLDYYENDVVKFLESIRFDSSENDIKLTVLLHEHILEVVFKNQTLKESIRQLPFDEADSLIPMDQLSWEIASYWRLLIEFLSNNEEFEEERDRVLTPLPRFSDYIKEYARCTAGALTAVQFLERQFILKQLFKMTRCYDFSDTWNRNCLNSLVREILESTLLMTDVTEVLVDTLEQSIPDIDKRTQYVNQIISEIVNPMDLKCDLEKQKQKEFQVSQFKVEINKLKLQLELAVQQAEYLIAEEIKQKLELEKSNLASITLEESPPRAKKTDLATTVKCLDIAAAILQSPQVTNLSTSLRSLKEDFIHDLLLNEHPTVQFKAMRCLAICCTLDKHTAATGIHTFSTVVFRYMKGDEFDKQTLCVSIMAITDMLRIYGTRLIAAPDFDALSESTDENHEEPFAGGTCLTKVLQSFADMMDDDDYEIQEIAGKALCQLLLDDCIKSPSLTSRLILKWCNPAAETSLSIIIGHILEKLPLIPEQCRQLKEAVMLTIRTIELAPRTSPFAEVDMENAVKFMLALLKISPSSLQIMRDLVKMILSEMQRNPRSRVNWAYSKMLVFIDITFETADLEEYVEICDELREEIEEVHTLNNLVKFATNLLKSLERCAGKDSKNSMEE